MNLPLPQDQCRSGRCAEPQALRRVLLLSESETPHRAARSVLPQLGWNIHSRFDATEALTLIAQDEFPVVLCDVDLRSGNWRSFLEAISISARPARLILFSRYADQKLWAEVLNLGAYDLLLFPFEVDELVRVISLAWHSWLREGQGIPKIAPPQALAAAVMAAAPGLPKQ